MANYRYYIILIFFLFFVPDLFSASGDSSRFEICMQKFTEFEFNDTLKALQYLEEATSIAEKEADLRKLGMVCRYWGWYHQDHTRHFLSLEMFHKSMGYYYKLKDMQGIADSYGNIGNIYEDLGDNATAIEYQLKSLHINEQILLSEKNTEKYRKALEGKAYALGNISNLYETTGDHEKALDYAFKCVEIEKKMGSVKSQDASYTNIGIIYRRMKKFEKAMEYHQIALRMRIQNNEINNLGSSYQNIAMVFKDIGMIDSALYYIDKAEIADRNAGNEWALTYSLTNKARILIDAGKYNEARICAEEALAICDKSEMPGRSLFAHELLYFSNRHMKNFETALKHHERLMFLKDSLNMVDARDQIVKKSMQHEFRMEKMTDSLQTVKNEEEMKVKHDGEIRQQKNYIYLALGGLSLFAVFAVVLYRGYKNKQRSNIALGEKNKIIHHQKELVEEKNKEITDSINYAKRLQEAILPRLSDIKSAFSESFVLYMPKDIVAGDFYFFEKTHSHIFIAAADCTGHGVPGAMVSVVCSNALNRAVKEFNLTDPGKILDKVTDLVISTFEKSESDVKDGMDISLCSLRFDVGNLKLNDEPNNLIFQWAGANNPLWIVQKEQGDMGQVTSNKSSNPEFTSSLIPHVFCLKEIKPDKQPIGRYDNRKPFTTHEIQLNKGDTIYVFTDGFADQFGGEQGKKLKQKKLREWITAFGSLPMNEQKEKLKEAILAWKGNLEQNDDITIIGFRL